MTASFPLASAPWIDVWDLDAVAARRVSLHEALTRAHRLHLHVDRSESIVLLRLLAAVLDAACGPRDTTEWDAAWTAPTLDAAAISRYLEEHADRLDLFHPVRPAWQCGLLTEYARGPQALHPGSLAGDAAALFYPWLDECPPLEPGQAAAWLLHLLAYDVAGIKRAAPGDPQARGGKLYGSQIGPLAAVTHAHITGPGLTLKAVLLLNLPPQPRAAGDAPVWERDTPPVPVRTRAAAGRLDLLTWPGRRIRLHVNDEGLVDAVAHHDGDRLDDTWGTVRRLDPMTAWRVTNQGAQVPLTFMDDDTWPQPWRPATLLDQPGACRVVDHAVAAAERGLLDADVRLHLVVSSVLHSNRHRANVSDIPVLAAPLGTAGLLADPVTREGVADMGRYADVIGSRLRKNAVRITGRQQLARRLVLADLDTPWETAVSGYSGNPAQARAEWADAVREVAERRIDDLPLRPMERGRLLAQYRDRVDTPKSEAQPKSAQAAGGKRRGPAARRYEVFGGEFTLSELARHPRCVVTYPTLRKRVDDGWDVEEAATTAGRRGPAASS
ncbi:type I-E CRISPR-associated protein Cse1/CasA [Streptomyces pseudogriseolus]|uniref:type I-E CRISPR-associated protein Cse1/CasA n=1 Tax=Streptomyces pseudogriseolus TaxID=36817 RepID=UPI003FA1EF26